MTGSSTDDPAPPAGRVSLKTIAAEQTRADIVRVALEVFADKGLAGARIDEIAARTATSKHMIYYHFGSKDGLYRTVLEHAYGRFRRAEESVDYGALDPEAALSALVGKSFDSHSDSPEFVRIIMSENIGRGAHIRDVAGLERRRAILPVMEAIVARGAAAGVFRQDIVILQLHMTISALCFNSVSNRFTFGHIFGIDMASPEQRAIRRAEIIDSILRICRA